jgi:hypothetical protein
VLQKFLMSALAQLGGRLFDKWPPISNAQKKNLSEGGFAILGKHFARSAQQDCAFLFKTEEAMIHVISKYLLASAVVGGCSVVFVLRAIRTTKNRRDGDRIYQFLRRSVKDGQYGFRSSEAISTVTNLRISRVVDLCSEHGHIERKEHERHMWRIGS